MFHCSRWRVVVMILMLFPLEVRGEDQQAHIFPRSNDLFHRLLADPRQAQTSLRYYRFAGLDAGDVALGNTWGMQRWNVGKGEDWAIQWGAEGMGYSRFLLSGAVNEFQTIDFFANIPVEIRHQRLSARITPFHESSHLGDDYFRRTNDKGFRYSVEGVRGILSIEPLDTVRFYGGGSYLLHTIPSSLGSGGLQGGLELTTPDLGWLLEHPCWIYLAQDFQSKEQTQWNVNSNIELGFRVAFREVIRSLRIHAGYFSGHSAFGQFFSRKETFFSLGTSFDF